MIGWERGFTGNRARKLSLTIQTNRYKPESVLENETHKILCDFQIQTDHKLSAKTNRHLVDFAVLEDQIVKIKERYILIYFQRTEKAVEHKSDGDTSYSC